jgi:hypothetical protein
MCIWTKCGQRPHRGCAVSDRAAASTVVRRGGPGVGRRLESHQVIVELIGVTTAHPGLWVRAALDPDRSWFGVRVGDQELATLHPVA